MRFQFGGHHEKPTDTMSRPAPTDADALVFFGATGDLAYKKIFPSLQAMVKRGHLNVPVIGVAKAGWDIEQFRERARDSLDKHGGLDPAAFAKLLALLRYVDGDYGDAATFAALRQALGPAQRPTHYLAIPPALFASVVEQLATAGCTQGARVIVEKPFGHDQASARGAERRAAAAPSTKRTSSASTITWARRRCTTCCTSALPTVSSNPSGTATTSKACRSPWPRTSACRAAAPSTTPPARCATWCRTTCSSC